MKILILINLAGTAFGFWYYQQQLSATQLTKLIFVPDCPLYTLLFALLLTSALLKKEVPHLAEITYLGLIKYGFWTVFVITIYHESYTLLNPVLYALMFILHIGMMLEAGLIPKVERFSRKSTIIAAAWFLANDAMDYIYNTHPYLPSEQHIQAIAIESLAMTILLTLWMLKRP